MFEWNFDQWNLSLRWWLDQQTSCGDFSMGFSHGMWLDNNMATEIDKCSMMNPIWMASLRFYLENDPFRWLVVWNHGILCFHILGIIIPTDFHIVQRGWTTNQKTCSKPNPAIGLQSLGPPKGRREQYRGILDLRGNFLPFVAGEALMRDAL